jgi:fucose 4-O-acetylase-like acetyltransferase
MIGEEVISGVINGFFTRHKIDKWARLILSCTSTALCTFFFTFGSAGITHLSLGHRPGLALTYATFEASISMSALVLYRWTQSDLTKGMPISVPGSLEQSKDKILQNDTVVTHGE